MDRDDGVLDLDLDRPADRDLPTGPVRRRPPRRLVVAALLLAGGLLALTRLVPAAPPEQPVPAPTAPPPQIAVQDLGHPLFGATTPWSLYLRAGTALVLVEPARGRVVATTLPAIGSGGPVRMVPGRDRAVLRPTGFSPALVVEEGRPPQPWTGGAGQGGVAFPGPDLDHLWVQPSGQLLRLVPFSGRAGAGPEKGPEMPLPPDSDPSDAVPDGTGFVVVHRTGGFYLNRPAGMTPITSDTLLGVGATAWVTGRCDDPSSCVAAVVPRAGGTRRTLPGRVRPLRGTPAAISPDGALLPVAGDAAGGLGLLDLRTGAPRPVLPRVVLRDGMQATAWSPDGRWLFAVDARGGLVQVDSRTGRAADTGLTLQPIVDVAIGR